MLLPAKVGLSVDPNLLSPRYFALTPEALVSTIDNSVLGKSIVDLPTFAPWTKTLASGQMPGGALVALPPSTALPISGSQVAFVSRHRDQAGNPLNDYFTCYE